MLPSEEKQTIKNWCVFLFLDVLGVGKTTGWEYLSFLAKQPVWTSGENAARYISDDSMGL